MISGTLQEYPQDTIRGLYEQSSAINKTWTDHGKKYITRKTLQDRIKEGLSKATTQSEVNVPGLPGTLGLYVIKFVFKD